LRHPQASSFDAQRKGIDLEFLDSQFLAEALLTKAANWRSIRRGARRNPAAA